MDIDNAKSYATKENLLTALRKAKLNDCKPIIVRNSSGRWTAIFGYNLSGVVNPPSIAHLGFMIIN